MVTVYIVTHQSADRVTGKIRTLSSEFQALTEARRHGDYLRAQGYKVSFTWKIFAGGNFLRGQLPAA